LSSEALCEGGHSRYELPCRVRQNTLGESLSKNQIKLNIAILLLIVPLGVGCGTTPRVGIKVPLEVMPSKQGELDILVENELKRIEASIESYLDQG